MLSDKTLAYGNLVTPALLGVDALYRAEPDNDGEGLVVLNMAEGLIPPQTFSSYTEARDRFQELEQLAASLPEADRRQYYRQLCHSTLAFIRWRAGQLDFPGQLQDFLHVPPAPADEAKLNRLRDQMHVLLTGMGYSGDLPSQCTAWEIRNCVPVDEVIGTITELASQAWDRTAALIELPAPKSDGMRFVGVRDLPFNARCDFSQRTVELNLDPVLTRPGLKHLVVHEGYPGHYVQFKLREAGYRRGTSAADGLLSVVNTASSSPFEGIADNGLQVLNWIESDDDRVSCLMNRYRAGIGTAAAWRLHALGRSEAQVRDWLREAALIGGEGWIANRMRFISAPSRATLIWSYWWGEAVVAPVWERMPADQRPAYLRFLYDRMHSLQTVSMFEA